MEANLDVVPAANNAQLFGKDLLYRLSARLRHAQSGVADYAKQRGVKVANRQAMQAIPPSEREIESMSNEEVVKAIAEVTRYLELVGNLDEELKTQAEDDRNARKGKQKVVAWKTGKGKGKRWHLA